MKKMITKILGIALLFLALNGCAMQTRIIEQRHWDLEETIRTTSSEQLLLNIVRLRYDDTPYFLQLASISTQFSAGINAGTSETIPAKGVNTLGLSGGMSYSESPVVTWSMPDTKKLYDQLLTPMSADQLTLLVSGGWDPEYVFLIGTQKMNSLQNTAFRFKEGFSTPETYEAYREVLQLTDELTGEGLADFAYGLKSSMGAGKIPMEKMDVTAIPDGLAYGLQFMTRDDPNVFEPLKLFKPLFLRFSKESDGDPRVRRLRELLRLDPAKYSFGIVDTSSSGTEQLLAESGKPSQVFNPTVKMSEIVLNNRSMLEVLYFASAYVQVPVVHQDSGVVRAETSVNDKLLNVYASATQPTGTWIKVKYHGYWFYISENDLRSRKSFSFLSALFESVVGNVPGAKPLMTLPVK